MTAFRRRFAVFIATSCCLSQVYGANKNAGIMFVWSKAAFDCGVVSHSVTFLISVVSQGWHRGISDVVLQSVHL